MTIPIKRWFELTDALLWFRTHPRTDNDNALMAMENITNWPWNASSEQHAEWQDIMNRTRKEFEGVINEQRQPD